MIVKKIKRIVLAVFISNSEITGTDTVFLFVCVCVCNANPGENFEPAAATLGNWNVDASSDPNCGL